MFLGLVQAITKDEGKNHHEEAITDETTD